MIKYAPGEQDKLIDNIINKNGRHSSEYNDYTFIELHGRSQRIDLGLLVKLVLFDEARYPQQDFMKLARYLKEFWYLVHCIPLRNVPLYINTIPEVAKWRLEIGK